MVSLKITENIIIKVLLAILGSWRWGPYGGPDLWRYGILSNNNSEFHALPYGLNMADQYITTAIFAHAQMLPQQGDDIKT